MVFGLGLCFCGEKKWRAVWLFSVARMASGAGCGFKILVWVCGLYFFWRVAKVWRARRADLVCVRGEIKEQGDLACGGCVGLRVWHG